MNFSEPIVTPEELYCLLGWSWPVTGVDSTPSQPEVPPLPAVTSA